MSTSDESADKIHHKTKIKNQLFFLGVTLFIWIIIASTLITDALISESTKYRNSETTSTTGINFKWEFHGPGYKEQMDDEFSQSKISVYLSDDFEYPNETSQKHHFVIHYLLLFYEISDDTFVKWEKTIIIDRNNYLNPFVETVNPDFPDPSGSVFSTQSEDVYAVSLAIAMGWVNPSGIGGMSQSHPTFTQFRVINPTTDSYNWEVISPRYQDYAPTVRIIKFISPQWQLYLTLNVAIVIIIAVVIRKKISLLKTFESGHE